MGKRAGRLLPLLRLMRVGLCFTAVSNIWLVALLSDGLGAEHVGGPGAPGPAGLRALPLWAVLVCTAAVACGMYVFGMVLNDVMDARRDRTFAPDRPIPSGRVGLGEAITIALAALVVAVAGSVPLGPMSTLLCLLCALLILFYDTVGKHLPGTGVVTLGLIRAAHMLIANPALEYAWPVWLTMSHVIGVSAAGHRLEEKRPRLGGRNMWVVVGGWAFVTVAMLAWMRHRGVLLPGEPAARGMWVGPTVAAAAFAVWAVWAGRRAPGRGRPRAAGGLIVRRGLLWLIVYDAAWLAGAGLWWRAGLIGLLAAGAIVTVSVMRQVRALSEPAEFQRER